eukprot:jgi/Tetstr1/451939/TSEL_038975.t1
MTIKKALITGITGQDGSYLAELLLEKGYEVHGIKRRASLFNTQRIDHLYQDPHDDNPCLKLHYGDLTDSSNLTRIVSAVEPDEIYNLGAQSHVAVSFEAPEYTADVDAMGTLRLLEAIRFLSLENKTRFYQASTSELYGLVQETPQTETTPFYPRSPYAAAKLYAYSITVNYREAYGIYACNGILFNHESPRRGETFVTRKITRGLANIALGLETCLYMGNIDALRDWGHAKDYVRMQWMMLQQEVAEDFVIATGKQFSVREFITWAASDLGITLAFKGNGIDEVGIVARVEGDLAPHVKAGDEIVKIDQRYFRPAEVETLLGDSTKAREKLGWVPEITAREMCREMGKRIWVAGHRGMVGSAVVRRLATEPCEVITAGRDVLDLTRQAEVEEFLADAKPDAIVLAAAKVGGILANDTYPVDFLVQNLQIETNILAAAHTNDVDRLLFLGSSCIYPKLAPQPITEEALLTGALEPTNEWYAIAKIAGIKLAQAYRKQHDRDFIAAMPANLYGPGDNFDLQSSHVLPALIRKAHEGKRNRDETITVWGTGWPKREFLHVDDCADALLFLLKFYSGHNHVNVGSGDDISILDLARLVCDVVGFEGEIVHDLSKPDGTPRKLMSADKLRSMGWSPKISLTQGISETYEWFLSSHANAS